MQAIKMEVNKKDPKNGGKYVKVGEVEIFVPLLSELVADAVQDTDDKGQPVFEDGIPVYKDVKHNYVQSAIFAAVKAQVRNKLVSGTATLKDGQSIPTNWDELTADSGVARNGDALAAVREAKEDFKAYVATLGKSANAQQMLNMLFGNKQALNLQSAENKTKMAGYVEGFYTSLDEAKTARYERYITSILTACEATEDAEDF